MELQDRFLSLDIPGDDVALPRRELGAISERYRARGPGRRGCRAAVGPGTNAAVIGIPGAEPVPAGRPWGWHPNIVVDQQVKNGQVSANLRPAPLGGPDL